MALQQSLGSMFIPSANPGMDPSAIDLETLCDLAGRLAYNAEHDRLQAQGDTRRFVCLSFLAQPFEAVERA